MGVHLCGKREEPNLIEVLSDASLIGPEVSVLIHPLVILHYSSMLPLFVTLTACSRTVAPSDFQFVTAGLV